MKKLLFFPFSMDRLLGKAEYVSPETLASAIDYEDEVQDQDDKLKLAKHDGEFVLVDSATGRIDFTEKNYTISRKAIRAFEAKMELEENEVKPTQAVLQH